MAVEVDPRPRQGVVSDVNDVEVDKRDNHKDQKGTWSDSEGY
jgi:hypothetical protein